MDDLDRICVFPKNLRETLMAVEVLINPRTETRLYSIRNGVEGN